MFESEFQSWQGRQKADGGPKAAVDGTLQLAGGYPPNSFSTFRSLCTASERAVVESCCRVCNARRFAPSSFESASVRLSAPVVSVLIIALVKSWRACTVERVEPNALDCVRSVDKVVEISSSEVWILAS